MAPIKLPVGLASVGNGNVAASIMSLVEKAKAKEEEDTFDYLNQMLSSNEKEAFNNPLESLTQ